MNKLLIGFILIVIIPSFAQADTIIFKDGSRLEVLSAWEEKTEVKCKMWGVIVGFPKEDISRIEYDPALKGLKKTETRNNAALSRKVKSKYHKVPPKSSIQLIEKKTIVPSKKGFAKIDEIRQMCKEKWGNKYDMVNYCIKNQRTAKRLVSRYSGLIRNQCERKWGNNYEMTLYCIKNQNVAKKSVDRSPSNEISRFCKNKWGTNFEMVNYCIKNQTTAKRSISHTQSDEISRFCENKWGTNYKMVDYCMKNQRTAKENIRRNYSANDRKYCERKWGINYEMVQYCLNN